MSDFTSRDCAFVHSSLDRLIAVRQPFTLPPRPRVSRGAFFWPSADDYERLDAQPRAST